MKDAELTDEQKAELEKILEGVEPTEYHPKTDDELKKIARDLADGKIWTDRHCDHPGQITTCFCNGALYGFWRLGQHYKKKHKNFYGAYPGNLLERIRVLFPDRQKVLHLFSGTLSPELNSIRFDVSDEFKPDICDHIYNIKDHAEVLSDRDIIIADPPYEKTDFERYGAKPFSKRRVIKDLSEVVQPGTFLCWLDTRLMQYSKSQWIHRGDIGVGVSSNHRVRLWTLLECV